MFIKSDFSCRCKFLKPKHQCFNNFMSSANITFYKRRSCPEIIYLAKKQARDKHLVILFVSYWGYINPSIWRVKLAGTHCRLCCAKKYFLSAKIFCLCHTLMFIKTFFSCRCKFLKPKHQCFINFMSVANITFNKQHPCPEIIYLAKKASDKHLVILFVSYRGYINTSIWWVKLGGTYATYVVPKK